VTDRARARTLAAESLARHDPVGWFERLYAEAARGEAAVPWDDRAPNPHVIAWLDRERPAPCRILDVGAGLGDTAEALAARGHRVVAFDVSPSAVDAARRRFPASPVRWEVADLLAPPAGWDAAFDLVVECYTLQVLPPDARARAVEALRRLVAPGGTLLVVARGREPDEPAGQMPWPLTRAEIEAIARDDLPLVALEDFVDAEDPPVRRFRAAFRRRPAPR
jgi:SAM-dependent methyltransferase